MPGIITRRVCPLSRKGRRAFCVSVGGYARQLVETVAYSVAARTHVSRDTDLRRARGSWAGLVLNESFSYRAAIAPLPMDSRDGIAHRESNARARSVPTDAPHAEAGFHRLSHRAVAA